MKNVQGVYGPNAKPLWETVRIDGAPAAVLGGNGAPYAVHPDYRNAPFLVRKADGGMVWGWQGNGAWSDIAPAHYQTGLRGMFDYTHALPGQIVDSDTPSLNPESPVRDNGARLMDPNTGRFLQVDPVLQQDGVSPYAFNDPVNFVDVDGRTADPIGYAGGMTASQTEQAYRQAAKAYGQYQAGIYAAQHPGAMVDAIPFNPVKGAVAAGNAGVATFNYAKSAAAFGGAAIVSFSPAAPSGLQIGLATACVYHAYAGNAAWERSRQTWGEALTQTWGDSRWQNLYGLVPLGGTQYDDPSEPHGPIEWAKTKPWGNFLNKLGL
ncbi:MAG: hypothetical protein IPI58_03070 [Alphaproteobacteria bacterium]|nr:MAG: hypothetical protein IPI58_03070 [Alphaproteobacteria bacterium]